LTQAFSAVISGLDESDYIDLKDLTFTSGQMAAQTTYLDGYTTLVVSNNFTSQSVTFTLAGNYTTSSWIFDNDGSGGTIFHDPPAADAGATTISGSTTTDLTQTVTAALTTQDGTADQFTFQSDSQSGTLAGDSTLAASGQDAGTTDAATLDASAATDNQPTTTAAVDTGLASTAATTSQPATTDSAASGTQAGATTQTATAAPGPNGDTFVFAANFGHETIANFHPDTDVIEIDHTVFADFQALLAATHDDANGNAVIAANPNDTITVKNVTVAQLVHHQSDFHFT
jgi:serralysin